MEFKQNIEHDKYSALDMLYIWEEYDIIYLTFTSHGD